MPTLSKPDIKLVRALQKDFETLYVKEFTTAWKENRLIRNIELGIMRLENTEKYIATQNTALLKELLGELPEEIDMMHAKKAHSDAGAGNVIGHNHLLSKVKNLINSKLAAMGVDDAK